MAIHVGIEHCTRYLYDRPVVHAPYFEQVENGPRLRAWVDGIDRRPQKIAPFLFGLNARLQRDIAYTVRMDPGVATSETTLEKALGSCRDTSWLLVQALRRLGLA